MAPNVIPTQYVIRWFKIQNEKLIGRKCTIEPEPNKLAELNIPHENGLNSNTNARPINMAQIILLTQNAKQYAQM